MSDTPETESFISKMKAKHGPYWPNNLPATLDFARTLETQRDEARAESVILQGYANRVQEMALTVSTVIQQREHALEKLENTEEERDEARAEVERLRKALRRLAAIASGGTINHAFVERVAAEACGDPDPYPAFAERLAEMAANKPTQPEIFEAHGREWYRHTPGDKMPCDGEMMVEWLTKEDSEEYTHETREACLLKWGESVKLSIIGWRPADAPEKLERK